MSETPKKPWDGGAFEVCVTRVDKKKPKRAVIEIPADTAELFYKLHGKITPAIRHLQELMTPRQVDVDGGGQEWSFNETLRGCLEQRDADIQQGTLALVDSKILEKELADRAEKDLKKADEAGLDGDDSQD